MTYQDNQVSWWNQIMGYFSGYPVWLIEGSFALLAGFLFGFIMKLFGKPLLYAVVTLVIAGYVLSYFGFIEFHFEQIQQALGIIEVPTIDIAFSNVISWMKEHVIICIGAVIGFAFGWRIG